MAGALYLMTFVGAADFGGGSLYVGNGKIVGVDVGNMRYHGSYKEEGGRLKGAVTLSAPTGGVLVTGQQLPAGTTLQLNVDWPLNFATGAQQPILVEGRPVHVALEKIGDT